MTPLITLCVAAAISFLFVMFTYTMTLFYIGKLSGHSLTPLMRAVGGIYDYRYYKQVRNFPWVAFQ